MTDSRHVITLSKAHRQTPVGRELIDLLRELSADGNVSREEMERLRAWLEVDRGVEFPALPYLYETIDQISSDGEVTEDELDRLALAIERVLPKDVRLAAAAERKQAREARRLAERETRRQGMITARTEKRTAQAAARARAGVLYQADFAVRGAFRFEERRDACERLLEGDSVSLEREPDNPHDANAIRVMGNDDCELGYVPREEARTIAPLLDAGAEAEAAVHRLWETPEGKVVPILLVKVRRGNAHLSVTPTREGRSTARSSKRAEDARKGCGCGTAVCLALLVLVLLLSQFAAR